MIKSNVVKKQVTENSFPKLMEYTVSMEESKMKFIQNNDIEEIMQEYPEYIIWARVEGGYMMFKSADEYQTWENQKQLYNQFVFIKRRIT